jgi:hypothetical protein
MVEVDDPKIFYRTPHARGDVYLRYRLDDVKGGEAAVICEHVTSPFALGSGKPFVTHVKSWLLDEFLGSDDPIEPEPRAALRRRLAARED